MSLFQSFLMGGFECATHRRKDGLQIDVLSATGHALRAAEDYRMLQTAGIRTVRDGMRWHLIEKAPGVYDWSSLLPMLEAARATETQVLWDLCHWGVPAWLDVFSIEFVERFGAFARAAAQLVFEFHGGLDGPVPTYCPINEISFWSWVGGDVQTFAPHRQGLGPVLKRQLARASLAAIAAVREIDPRARFVHAEPIIHIEPNREDIDAYPEIVDHVARHVAAQFEAWDLICGALAPELGGSATALDMIGVNYYWNNQWVHGGERMPPGHDGHRPLHRMLLDLWDRYRRPILITETGVEAHAAPGWLGYVAAEVRQAQRAGAQIEGICLYPVMDYPGWDDERHCSCGLIAVDERWEQRTLRSDLLSEVRVQEACFGSPSFGSSSFDSTSFDSRSIGSTAPGFVSRTGIPA